MALQPCPECGREVSSEAPLCPFCGVPIKTAPPSPPAKKAGGCGTVFLVVCVIVAIIVIVGVVVQGSGPGEPRHPSSGIAHIKDKDAIIWKGRDGLKTGVAMLRSGTVEAHGKLFRSYVACFLAGDEQVTVLGIEVNEREVIVDSGPNKDCRGWIQATFVVP